MFVSFTRSGFAGDEPNLLTELVDHPIRKRDAPEATRWPSEASAWMPTSTAAARMAHPRRPRDRRATQQLRREARGVLSDLVDAATRDGGDGC